MGTTGSKVTTASSSVDHPVTKSVKKSSNNRRKNVPLCVENQSCSQNEKASSLSKEKPPRFIENTILIWLDASLEEQVEADNKPFQHIRHITGILLTFSNLEKCFEFIKSVKDEKIFLIVSGSFGAQIVPRIDQFNQVQGIYIFCGNKANHIEWTKPYKKIRGIHTQTKEICETIKYHIQQYDNSLTSFTIFPACETVELNQSNIDFIYSQVMKLILLDNHHEKTALRKFINYAREFYSNNEYQSTIINTLDENYDLHAPVWWYTRKCCIYYMLRKAFLTDDFEIISKLAFFIQDLHREIKKTHSQIKNYQANTIYTYRATRMTNEEFVNIENNRKGLIGFDDFLLTTVTRGLALKFATAYTNDPDSIGIIYKIHIDPLTSIIPYISLNNISYSGESHGEILFSMNTFFNIYQIEKQQERLYEISLVPPSKRDEQVKNLTAYIKEKTAAESGWFKLTKILMDVHDYDKVKNIYSYMYDHVPEQEREQRAALQHELGHTCELQGDLSTAISHYKQAIDLYLNKIPATHPALLSTYTSLAGVLQKQGDFDGALVYYQHAMKIERSNDLNPIVQLNNIGTVLGQQGKYTEAQQTFEKVIQILHRDFPSAYSELADTYHNMGGMFYSMKDYSKALAYYEKTLEIEGKTNVSNPATLQSTFFNMATTYEGLKSDQLALKHAEKAVDAAHAAFGDQHPETKENKNYLEQLRHKSSNPK